MVFLTDFFEKVNFEKFGTCRKAWKIIQHASLKIHLCTFFTWYGWNVEEAFIFYAFYVSIFFWFFFFITFFKTKRGTLSHDKTTKISVCPLSSEYSDQLGQLSNVIRAFAVHSVTTWVKVFRMTPEFRILRLTFHRKSASKSWILQIVIAFLI